MNLKQSIEEIIKQPDYEPMSVSDFQDALGLNSADSFRDLIKVLVELEQTGLIQRTKTDRYQRKASNNAKQSKLIKGKLSQNKKVLLSYVLKKRIWMTFSSHQRKSIEPWMVILSLWKYINLKVNTKGN